MNTLILFPDLILSLEMTVGDLGTRLILLHLHTHHGGTVVVEERWYSSVLFCDFSHLEYYIYTLNDYGLT